MFRYVVQFLFIEIRTLVPRFLKYRAGVVLGLSIKVLKPKIDFIVWLISYKYFSLTHILCKRAFTRNLCMVPLGPVMYTRLSR